MDDSKQYPARQIRSLLWKAQGKQLMQVFFQYLPEELRVNSWCRFFFQDLPEELRVNSWCRVFFQDLPEELRVNSCCRFFSRICWKSWGWTSDAGFFVQGLPEELRVNRWCRFFFQGLPEELRVNSWCRFFSRICRKSSGWTADAGFFSRICQKSSGWTAVAGFFPGFVGRAQGEQLMQVFLSRVCWKSLGWRADAGFFVQGLPEELRVNSWCRFFFQGLPEELRVNSWCRFFSRVCRKGLQEPAAATAAAVRAEESLVSVKTILRKYDIKACPAAADGPEADRLLRFILLRGSQEGRAASEVFKDVQEVARVRW